MRYIKPDFFIDPDLCELSFAHRLVFEGLWVHADREGRLIYEPKKLKVQIMPYDKVDMVKILDDLAVKPFIHIYETTEGKFIQIVNWHKHQKAQASERESVIPEFNGENIPRGLKSSREEKNPRGSSKSEIKILREGEGEGEGDREGEGRAENLFVQNVFNYFCLKTNKKLSLSEERKKIIERLKERPIEDIKKAIDNFCADDWSERHKFMDVVYCLGIRDKIDNFEKWFNATKKKPDKDCKKCPSCGSKMLPFEESWDKCGDCIQKSRDSARRGASDPERIGEDILETVEQLDPL